MSKFKYSIYYYGYIERIKKKGITAANKKSTFTNILEKHYEL